MARTAKSAISWASGAAPMSGWEWSMKSAIRPLNQSLCTRSLGTTSLSSNCSPCNQSSCIAGRTLAFSENGMLPFPPLVSYYWLLELSLPLVAMTWFSSSMIPSIIM